MATIFSDTSILIQKLMYDRNRREEIEGNIEGQKFITCQYVLMEFRRNILQSMNYLRSILREMTLQGKEEIQLDELLVHLSFARGLFYSTRAVQSLPSEIANIEGDEPYHRLELPKQKVAELIEW